MSSPAGMSPWPNNQPQYPPRDPTRAPQGSSAYGESQDGVSLKELKLKILYTFDNQSFLVRPPDLVQIQTVFLDASNVIGVIDLSTCLHAIVQSSPELLAGPNQDYTVYAYDFSEYDTPLVGQGMLSKALAVASQISDPNQRPLITGRVCENIVGRIPGMRVNGARETLEVKLKLVPVPIVPQNSYGNPMQRSASRRATPTSFDPNEWSALVQPVPNVSRNQSPLLANSMQQDRQDSNPGFSPRLQQPPAIDSFNQPVNTEQTRIVDQPDTTTTAKKRGRPPGRSSSRASVKRPRGSKAKAAVGGNTSGYEEGTDGDDGPAPPKRRAKVTKADRSNNATFGTGNDSLRVTASTAGSLRTFRPIAMAGPTAGSHLQDIPRAPTPVPIHPNQHLIRDRAGFPTALRRESSSLRDEPSVQSITPPYPILDKPEDEVRNSIESANPSPEPGYSPAVTPQDIASSPPVMRTRPATEMGSSPPCPSSPILPQMPRTDSGFMSGSLEEIFGEDDDCIQLDDDELAGMELPQPRRDFVGPAPSPNTDLDFVFEEPGARENLPTRMPIIEAPDQTENRARAARSAITRANSVVSEDGQSLPPLRKPYSHPRTRMSNPHMMDSPKPGLETPAATSQLTESALFPPDYQLQTHPQPQPQSQLPGYAIFPPVHQPSSQPQPELQTRDQTQPLQTLHPPPQFPPHPTETLPIPESRTMLRTASVGSLNLPTVPASDPVFPPSALHRSQTWSEAPHPETEAPQTRQESITSNGPDPNPEVPYSRTLDAKKASIKKKLMEAIEKGQPPPFCSNCGAIETPTWRRAFSKNMIGAPGFNEYSEELGRVTAITVKTRDLEGKPTSYDIIKKLPYPEEKVEYIEILLCNPCGIWMSKYKCHRPEERWNVPSTQRNRQPAAEPKKRRNRAKAAKCPTSEANFPQSETNFPQSEANFPNSEANFPPSDVNYPNYPPSEAQFLPTDTNRPPETMGPPVNSLSAQPVGDIQQQPEVRVSQATLFQPRSHSFEATKLRKAMISDNVPAALRRAIQSSPARWSGTQQCPIELEEKELASPTRRLLFSLPQTAGSPKVLGEPLAQVVDISSGLHVVKENSADLSDKENCPPAIQHNDIDEEFVRMLEESMAQEDPTSQPARARPTTPVRDFATQSSFKTPTRKTPSHRMITRSVSASKKSNRSRVRLNGSAGRDLEVLLKTPTRTPRRSPRNALFANWESPFTAAVNQMNQMMAENQETSPSRILALDFGHLPPLPEGHDLDSMTLDDFFSTDAPMPTELTMPSSPPRLFQLYEDPNTATDVGNDPLDDFGKFDAAEKVTIKQEPGTTPKKGSEKSKDIGGEEA